ncbi:rbpD [Blepharisma stoltei]|uniref:RRM domain-containing protein n=1 Tax=Blepharisma stoltei TaxID=1481888 RepID=A0AAU9I7B9_9CILI|nr:unnamed protein product [Blepharisma stoltei]
MSDRYQENRDTLFVRNLASEVTEETLRSFFEPYGRVTQCSIPKEFNTGRPKSFGFVTFSTEDDAARALEATDRKNFLGKSLLITYAYGNRRKDMRYGSPKYSTRSRSRSRSWSRSRNPIPKNLTLESELKNWCEQVSRLNDELHKKNLSLIKQNEDLSQELRKAKIRKDSLKKELESYKSQTMIFLPCGHQKNVLPREKNLIDDLYELGISKLTPEERMNETLLRQLKSKIFYIMEGKFPNIYKCKQKENFIIGTCGHIAQAECWDIRNIKKNQKKVACTELVDKILPCGHTEKVECSKISELTICKIC